MDAVQAVHLTDGAQLRTVQRKGLAPFPGLLIEPTRPHLFADQMGQFICYMRDEKGLSPATIASRFQCCAGLLVVVSTTETVVVEH